MIHYTFTWGQAAPERYNDDGKGLALELLTDRVVAILSDWLDANKVEHGEYYSGGHYPNDAVFRAAYESYSVWRWMLEPENWWEGFTPIAFPWTITLPAVWLLPEQTLLVEKHLEHDGVRHTLNETLIPFKEMVEVEPGVVSIGDALMGAELDGLIPTRGLGHGG